MAGDDRVEAVVVQSTSVGLGDDASTGTDQVVLSHLDSLIFERRRIQSLRSEVVILRHHLNDETLPFQSSDSLSNKVDQDARISRTVSTLRKSFFDLSKHTIDQFF